jgi:hypothetical protein
MMSTSTSGSSSSDSIYLNDLSSLYLRRNDSTSNKNNAATSPLNLPLIGPIKIASSSTNANITEGRGLIATRSIKAGECLFVTKPAVDAPVEEVKRVWLNKCKSGESEMDLIHKLEQIAETILVKKTKRILKSKDDAQRILAMSILSQVGDHHKNEEYQTDDINIISGRKSAIDDKYKSSASSRSTSRSNSNSTKDISNGDILSIIHRNAFGPDFRHYHSIATNWLTNSNDKNPYGRILGLYPLSAMINHSCKPNAVRVYSCHTFTDCTDTSNGCDNSDVMAVHATQPIKEGEEIVWSYVPTSRPYYDRQMRLKETFGFDCICPRCKAEESIYNNNDEDGNAINNELDLTAKMALYAPWNEKSTDVNALPSASKFRELMFNFEAMISDKRIPGEICRYLRVGMVTFYTNYFNTILSNTNNDNNSTAKAKTEILGLAAKIHLSLASVDHGTTEHLSILHLCYELASQEQQQSKNRNKNLTKFWSGQLQKAHECRYGFLGGKVDKLREMMIHSRSVLRQRMGFEDAKYCFI